MTAQEKEVLNRIYKKHYKNKTPMDKVNARLAEAGIPIHFASSKPKQPSSGPNSSRVGTRLSLMLAAKEKGIKNYRILNKSELVKVLDPTIAPGDIRIIVDSAVARWKAGWKKEKV